MSAPDQPSQASCAPPTWPLPFSPGCCLCRRPNPGGFIILAAGPGGGAKLPTCAVGEGCKDGTVYHGPNGPPPHPPGDACAECERNTGRAELRPRSRNNRRS